ncbi:MAG: aminopeptidase P family protein [Anaerolineae bacterium]|nr:aminopeptidase P family protein [Anaerolineae bacterium]
MYPSIRIPPSEFAARMGRLIDHLASRELAGAVLFDAAYILYYADFAFIPTERPMALAVSAGGERALLVPRLELEHARGEALVDRVEAYPEYPDDPHPMEHLRRLLDDLGIRDRVGADDDGYPWVLGYQGPSLSALTGAAVHPLRPFVEAQMQVKSPAEVALIRESATWGHLAHRLLQRYTRAGGTETEAGQRASHEATRAMLDALGPLYQARSAFAEGASAGYRGQIGRGGAIPHAMAGNVSFMPGDLLVSGAGAAMWGYHSELERTMVIGPPSDEQRRLFEHMLALQQSAFDALRPGVPCSDVDRAVRRQYEALELLPYWKHHSGHGIGLRYHEGPFLDRGDHTVLRPGMVLTVEPGLYVEGLGGFRHSDTVLIGEEGMERITYYARDLASLIL